MNKTYNAETSNISMFKRLEPGSSPQTIKSSKNQNEKNKILSDSSSFHSGIFCEKNFEIPPDLKDYSCSIDSCDEDYSICLTKLDDLRIPLSSPQSIYESSREKHASFHSPIVSKLFADTLDSHKNETNKIKSSYVEDINIKTKQSVPNQLFPSSWTNPLNNSESWKIANSSQNQKHSNENLTLKGSKFNIVIYNSAFNFSEQELDNSSNLGFRDNRESSVPSNFVATQQGWEEKQNWGLRRTRSSVNNFSSVCKSLTPPASISSSTKKCTNNIIHQNKSAISDSSEFAVISEAVVCSNDAKDIYMSFEPHQRIHQSTFETISEAYLKSKYYRSKKTNKSDVEKTHIKAKESIPEELFPSNWKQNPLNDFESSKIESSSKNKKHKNSSSKENKLKIIDSKRVSDFPENNGKHSLNFLIQNNCHSSLSTGHTPGQSEEENNGWVIVRRRRRKRSSPDEPSRIGQQLLQHSKSSHKKKCKQKPTPQGKKIVNVPQRKKSTRDVEYNTQVLNRLSRRKHNKSTEKSNSTVKLKNSHQKNFVKTGVSGKKQNEEPIKNCVNNSSSSLTRQQQDSAKEGNTSYTDGNSKSTVPSSILNDPKTSQVVSSTETFFTVKVGLKISREKCFLYGIHLQAFAINDILSIGQSVTYDLEKLGNCVRECWIGAPTLDMKQCYQSVDGYCRTNKVPIHARCKLLREIDYVPDTCAPIVITSGLSIVSLDVY